MIETERLLLRPFREGDAADVFEYLKEPTVNCFACMKLNSLEEAKKAVVERSKDAEGNPIYENTIQWAILKKEWEGNAK